MRTCSSRRCRRRCRGACRAAPAATAAPRAACAASPRRTAPRRPLARPAAGAGAPPEGLLERSELARLGDGRLRRLLWRRCRPAERRLWADHGAVRRRGRRGPLGGPAITVLCAGAAAGRRGVDGRRRCRRGIRRLLGRGLRSRRRVAAARQPPPRRLPPPREAAAAGLAAAARGRRRRRRRHWGVTLVGGAVATLVGGV